MSADSLAIINIGTLVSGTLSAPVLDADTIVTTDGVIEAIGRFGDLRIPDDAVVIDAAGATVTPGLRDNHVHPVFGDFSPRQNTLGWIDACLHGGVTTMYSAGEPHLPGRPSDPAGMKALAILAHKSFDKARPSGVKVHAGAILLEPGLVESDFDDLVAAGCRLVGEIGISGLTNPTDAAQMTRWAQARGMKVMVHTGGASIPGSSVIGPDFVAEVRPDVAGHVNGGPTSLRLSDVVRILDETDARVEIVHNGNITMLGNIVRLVRERGELERIVIGTDAPAGSGAQPLGVLRVMASAASLGGIDGPTSVALATGNVARLHADTDGVIAVGCAADLLVVDAPMGSQADTAMGALEIGDTLAVAFAIIDGRVAMAKSRNTPPPTRKIVQVGAHAPSSGH
jgi:enamidase